MPFDLVELFKSLISSFYECFFIVFTSHKLSQKEIIPNKRNLFKFASFVISLCIATYIDNNTLFFRILPLVIFLFFIKYIINDKLFHCVYLFFISYIIIFFIQLSIAFIIPLSVKNQDAFLVQLLGNNLTLLCLLLIAKFLPIHRIYEFVKKKDIPLRFILGNTFVILILVNYLLNVHTKYFLYYIIPITVVVGLMIYVNYELIHSRGIIDRLEKNIESYNKYLPIVNELIGHVRTKQHAYNNDIQSLRFLAYTCEDYDTLKEELTKNLEIMCEKSADINCLKLNLKLLAGILIQKQSQAANCGISIIYNITNYYITSKVPEYVIVELVGILLDNAIEASPKGSTIYVDLNCVNNTFIFDVKNPFSEVTADFKRKVFKKGYSTKSKDKENRGEGLYILRTFVKYYKGTVVIATDTIDDVEYVEFCINL